MIVKHVRIGIFELKLTDALQNHNSAFLQLDVSCTLQIPVFAVFNP